MKAVISAIIFGCFLLGAIPAHAAERAKEPLVEQVRKAIEDAKKFLRDRQNADGGWEDPIENGGHDGGWTDCTSQPSTLGMTKNGASIESIPRASAPDRSGRGCGGCGG